MSKKSRVEKKKKIERLIDHYAEKRKALKAVVGERDRPIEERIQAVAALAKLPRNSAPSRHRNRCELTGRPRGYYRRFGLCRNMLREYASRGELPGVCKSSW